MADSRPDFLETGDFTFDHTVELDSGGWVRLAASGSMLVTNREELDFIYSLVSAMRDFQSSRGIVLAESVTPRTFDEDD